MLNVTQTTNGAKAYKSSLDAIVDLFYFGPMSRNKSQPEIISYFDKAFEQDKTLALRTLFIYVIFVVDKANVKLLEYI